MDRDVRQQVLQPRSGPVTHIDVLRANAHQVVHGRRIRNVLVAEKSELLGDCRGDVGSQTPKLRANTRGDLVHRLQAGDERFSSFAGGRCRGLSGWVLRPGLNH